MKINSMQINAFGNIENKSLELKKGINIIYGENEKGKSTLAIFLKSIFYGVNKLKAGNNFSEYERYKPWINPDFSGKIEYEIDGEKYSVFRDFNKNVCKVFDNSGNDITNTFPHDKARGAEVGKEHLKVDEDTYLNTLFIAQKNTKIEFNNQRDTIQKLANILQTGNESTSVQKIKAKLQKKLLDEVGTDRTHSKPINLVLNDIFEKEKLKNTLVSNRYRNDDLNVENKKLEEQIKRIEDDMDQINQILEIKNKYLLLNEERQRGYEFRLKLKEKEEEEKKLQKKKQKLTNNIMTWGIATIFILVLAFIKQYIFTLPVLIIAIVVSLIINLKKETEKEEVVEDLAVIKEEINKKEKKELAKLCEQGIKNSFAEKKVQELESLYKGYENKKNDLILEGHKNKIEENSLRGGIEKLSEIEEDLENLYEKKELLSAKAKAISKAIESLDEAYKDIQADVIPAIGKSIEEMISKTTNGEYKKVIYNSEKGILITNAQGDLTPVEKLSFGTIDQMYLGFRMGVAEKCENLPIVLDESFVYYDDNRLNNILKTLSEIDRQVLILTCSDREMNILEKLKINYNFIKL